MATGNDVDAIDPPPRRSIPNVTRFDFCCRRVDEVPACAGRNDGFVDDDFTERGEPRVDEYVRVALARVDDDVTGCGVECDGIDGEFESAPLRRQPQSLTAEPGDGVAHSSCFARPGCREIGDVASLRVRQTLHASPNENGERI
jgi:hypothetical protein